MWSRGKISRAIVGTVSVFFCWCTTSSEALCGTSYGLSAGTSNPFSSTTTTSNDLFTCAEGTFLRSVVFAGLSIRVFGVRYECSDGELSELFGDDSLGHYVASCPDPEGFGIGSINLTYIEGDGFHRAVVSCAGSQDCRGYICDANGDNCEDGGEDDYCGPIGWDTEATYPASNTTGCDSSPGEYLVGFRTLSLDSGGSGDGATHLTAACASISACPLDRPDTFWDSGINIARAVFGVSAAIIFAVALTGVILRKHSGTHNKSNTTTPETYTASLAGAFTALGGTLAEALAGSNAAAVGFAVTCAFALLCAYHCHPSAAVESSVPVLTPAESPSFYDNEAEIVQQGIIRV